MSSPPPSKYQKTGTKEKTGVKEKTGTKAKAGTKETGTKAKAGTKKTGTEEGTKEKKKREKKSTQLYNQLRLEGPTRKADTGLVVDRDDRLPEEADKLHLLAEIYWNAGCRTWAQIAAEGQANASNASSATPVQINVTHTHTHIHPHSNPSARNISHNVQAITGLPVAGSGEGPEGEDGSDVVDIPTLGLRCSVAEIPAPPALSYTADHLQSLVHDWDSGARLQIRGVYVPLKHWPEIYAKHRGDIYPKRKEIWRQWRTVVLAFKELGNWEEFWARYGQEANDGSGRRVECSWTALKANIKKYRSELDAEDVARATQQFGGLNSDEFAKHFSTVKSGRRTVMKSQQEIAHRFRIMIEEPNIWDQAF